jgi:hypothetical protein
VRGLLHIQKKGVDNPCPSLKSGRKHWRSGEPGYALYPQENISKQEQQLGEFRWGIRPKERNARLASPSAGGEGEGAP